MTKKRGCLLKLDFFHCIEPDGCYYGRRKMSTEEDLERLRLPLLVPRNEEETFIIAFTVSVDAKVGISTGISAADRANTVLALASSDSKAEDLRRPGLKPVSVLSQVVVDDGSIDRLTRLKKFAMEYNLPIISIADLIRYRRKREKLVEQTVISHLPTKRGSFQVYRYRSKLDGIEHVAMVKVRRCKHQAI
ncbi:hypothetical protein SUGI_0685370 [Cryptomeria japonica]|nr:hypothetical protein SUGI_0685370 [Cryptomeria japonica]